MQLLAGRRQRSASPEWTVSGHSDRHSLSRVDFCIASAPLMAMWPPSVGGTASRTILPCCCAQIPGVGSTTCSPTTTC
eukprot:2535021-Prymnesium_polylepis.2